MSRHRLVAPLVAAAVSFSAVSAVPAPQASAYEVDVDAETDQCTITFSDTDQARINGAYTKMFVYVAQNARDSFEKENAQEDAKLVWDYAIQDTVKSASDLAIGKTIDGKSVSDAQTRLALGPEKAKYWQMVAYLNASKKPVVGEEPIEMSRREANEKGSPLYGVDFGSAVGGAIGGLLLGGDVIQIRDAFLNALKDRAPEFAAPIVGYSTAFSACAKGEDKTSSVPDGSSLTTKQLAGLGIGGLVALIISLIGIGFGLRPVVDQLLAQFRR
ncbi:hypothetical protein [Corynebacterium sp.]|uniref:hypothetical protein n=1 Tax=Corynebacterium sp. TaxID=1720 RepID=UPI0026DB9C84|nr:hypothetical protein [Corynebacterium sp.]MDO5032759.1 hypothetical protein [Corynebacterium sp.]